VRHNPVPRESDNSAARAAQARSKKETFIIYYIILILIFFLHHRWKVLKKECAGIDMELTAHGRGARPAAGLAK
jgi:hypothetical protein